MELITVLRAQLPLPAPPAPVVTAPRATPPDESPAVAAPQQAAALQPPRSTMATLPVELAETDADRHPAAEARLAAEAAREAYIRASIAAGLSPLPLP